MDSQHSHRTPHHLQVSYNRFMSMRGVETDPIITSITPLVREERMVMN